ncbi:Intraflagellar transport protein 172 [Diplonema papillatum]|nr:Intraflagellar transport protein 172 [Diplonema papillatum]
MRKLFTIDFGANGKGPVYFAWSKGGNLLAICGVKRQLTVVDREGKVFDQKTLSHPGAALAVEWDHTGETVAVMQAGTSVVTLWHVAGKKMEPLDTGFKDLTWMSWNKTGPHLAVGTLKGNLLLYNKKTLKKMPSMGKHTKRILCGAWSNDGKLALGGEDRVLSVNTAEGDLIRQQHLKAEPTQCKFANMQEAFSYGKEESTISVNLGGKTLLLYNTTEQQGAPAPYELAFLAKYGSIVQYKWFGDGYILIGFSSGHVNVVSTHEKEVGKEISYIVPHKESLNDITYCPVLQKGASIGDSCVQVFSMDEIDSLKSRESDRFDLNNEYGALMNVDWTDDGQILTVSSRNGNIHTFLTRIPIMHDSYGSKVLHLTSLRELCIRSFSSDSEIATIRVEIEPSFVALGPDHAAVGMNNCVWYYRYKAGDVRLVNQKTYVSSIDSVKLSQDYAAVLSDGRVTLHIIESGEAGSFEDERRHQRVFPEKEGDSRITSVAITKQFLIYGTSTGVSGSIAYFSLEDWSMISELPCNGVRSVYPNPAGTRCVYIDETGQGYIYSPADDTVCQIARFSVHTDKIMWDNNDWGVFVGCDQKHFVVYVYAPNTRWGQKCHPVWTNEPGKVTPSEEPRTTDRPFGFMPILVFNGGVVCQLANGSMPMLALYPHQNISPNVRSSAEFRMQAFYNSLSLHRLEEARNYAKLIQKPECWYALGDTALYLLDIKMAIRVYRMVEQPAMVLALNDIVHINEKALLLGHVAMLFKNFNEAQNHFVRSSNPMLALTMRRDLMHWNEALALSESLAPHLIPSISREYASQLEFRGELQQALEMYSKGTVEFDPDVHEQKKRELEKHNEQCRAGFARITIRVGDIARGFEIAMQSDSKTMAVECAQILEELRQWSEAAQLYEKAEQYDKAAQIYICQTKNLRAAANLMSKISSHKIQALYGSAKEKEGSYQEAKEAYIKAEDWDNVVRLLVEHLNDISSAYDVVRKTKSAEAAAVVAAHCKKFGNPETAIEFLLLAKKTKEAFDLAATHDSMRAYASILGENGTNNDYLAIAKHYEEKGNFALSGDFYRKCKQHHRALQKYIDEIWRVEATVQKGANAEEVEVVVDEILRKCISVVGEAQNDMLQYMLINVLTDENNPRDPKYSFSLYMELGKYEKGCNQAVIMARQQQNQGHYRIAHRLLFQTYKQLEKHGVSIASELRWNLMLLHSYLIAKPLIKTLSDHTLAARMLIRVAKNIPKFPQHTVQILTSCVTECNKAGFDKSAYKYAKQLVTSDRKEIPEKHRKKMDTIVRKPGYYSKDSDGKKKTEADLTDPQEPVGPCPFCSAPVPMTMLDCPRCKSNIPYCIATGQHMLLEEWACCSSCKFPGLYGPLSTLIRQGEPCPMCEEVIDVGDIKRIANPDPSVMVGVKEQEPGTSEETPPNPANNEGAA